MISEQMTINEVVHVHPETIPAFAAAGLDTCCGGALPIEVAADRHNVDLEKLLAAANALSGILRSFE